LPLPLHFSGGIFGAHTKVGGFCVVLDELPEPELLPVAVVPPVELPELLLFEVGALGVVLCKSFFLFSFPPTHSISKLPDL
ncbi:hypothetical protein QG055_10140, partial [Kingella kingae]|uniref:hypothetical protein n=1 Tax=Kingella kingae TaxID=504 RepID=UPI002556F79C